MSGIEALQASVSGFLSSRRIAVVGVSRDSRQAANAIFRKLQEVGYEVVAVNPKAAEAEGATCYASLDALPEKPDAVVGVIPAAASAELVRDCSRLGVSRVWLHRGLGPSSVAPEAVAVARELGVELIPGACPMMYLEPVDGFHRCFRWALGACGRLPEPTGSKGSRPARCAH